MTVNKVWIDPLKNDFKELLARVKDLEYQMKALTAWVCSKHSIEIPNTSTLLSWYNAKVREEERELKIRELIQTLKFMGFTGFKEEIQPVSYETGLRRADIE